MNKTLNKNEFDAIIVGSGTAASTISRELSKQKKKVLILEQGADTRLRESISGFASVAQEVPVADNIKVLRAVTAGGSTALYFAVTKLPYLDAFLSVGIDLSRELEEAKKELPLAELPDELLAPQAIRLRQSAMELGYDFKKNLMLIDQTKCTSGYSYDSKWQAKSFLQEAIKEGTTLITQAKVLKVLLEKKRAIGVEYKLKKGIAGSEICQAYGTKIILAAGSFSSPKILQDSGIKDIGSRGFFCKPGFVMFGTVPGMKGKDNFLASMNAYIEDDIIIGDGNMSASLFKMISLSEYRLTHIFSHSKTLVAGVSLNDGMGGELKEDGSYNKQLTKEEFNKLKVGEEAAIKILKNAGAKNIYKTRGFAAGNPGGVVRIQEHLDANLETKFRNLYVCDASVISDVRITPTLTLVCLGKYLAKHLLSSL